MSPSIQGYPWQNADSTRKKILPFNPVILLLKSPLRLYLQKFIIQYVQGCRLYHFVQTKSIGVQGQNGWKESTPSEVVLPERRTVFPSVELKSVRPVDVVECLFSIDETLGLIPSTI